MKSAGQIGRKVDSQARETFGIPETEPIQSTPAAQPSSVIVQTC